jgi:hypothetical protein
MHAEGVRQLPVKERLLEEKMDKSPLEWLTKKHYIFPENLKEFVIFLVENP